MMSRKLGHFRTRYLEHFKSIEFAQKKKAQIVSQINEFLNLENKYTTNELKFLEEIAELVIRARRAITYTYPLRFFLTGGKIKKQYFDFI